MKGTQPPKWIDRLLEWYCSDRYLEEVQGDLHEWFARRVEKQGVSRAKFMYLYDVIAYLRWFRIKNLNDMSKNNNALFFSYLKIAIRQFKRNLGYSVMNTLGLAIGIFSALLISIYILDELSYDRFHKDSDKIYRLVNTNPAEGIKFESNPSPWKMYMTEAFPEVEAHTRLGQDNVLLKVGGQSFLETDFYWTDANFMTFFDFEILYGDRKTMLEEPNTLVLTKSKALRYFGKEDVVGEMLPIKVYDGNQDFLMKITGVVNDPPRNSHLQFSFLGSMSTTHEMYGRFNDYWSFYWLRSYVKLADGVSSASVEAKIPAFFEKYRGEGSSKLNGIMFQPLTDIRLYSNDIGGNTAKGDINYIYLFGFVAFLILLAAAINYVNLITANSSRRGKEVGMRKVFGAYKWHIVKQFYVECGFQLFSAFIIAIGLACLLLPYFNDVVDKQLILSDLFQPQVIEVMALVFVVLLVLSGFYPALVMNRFRPIEVLKKNVTGVFGQNSVFRQFQVLIQFSIASFLIASTLIVVSQFKYFVNYDKGFYADQLINVPVDDRELQKKLTTIKEQMSHVPGVQEITASGEALPSAMNNTVSFSWQGKKETQQETADFVAIDFDYLETIGAKLSMGRNLSKDMPSDSSKYCLLNESAFRLTGWKDLENKKVYLEGSERFVAGVIENFNYRSLHSSIQPAVYMIVEPGGRANPDNLIIKLESSSLATSIQQLDDIWQQFSPQPFEFSHVDEAFSRLYGNEKRFMSVVVGFTTIGISLAVLGLIGLISFVAQKRSKEISIRKVLGASRGSILIKIGGQFIQIFVVSVLIALPLSKMAMENWLENFAYRIQIDWKIFLVSGAISVFLTLISVGFQAFKVASSNPVKHLSEQ